MVAISVNYVEMAQQQRKFLTLSLLTFPRQKDNSIDRHVKISKSPLIVHKDSHEKKSSTYHKNPNKQVMLECMKIISA